VTEGREGRETQRESLCVCVRIDIPSVLCYGLWQVMASHKPLVSFVAAGPVVPSAALLSAHGVQLNVEVISARAIALTWAVGQPALQSSDAAVMLRIRSLCSSCSASSDHPSWSSGA